MDYRKIIDQETWRFIERSLAVYPADAASWPVEKNRQVYDAMRDVFACAPPAGVSSRDGLAGQVPVRIYECGPPGAVVVYFHGGGFILGGLDSHDDVCADLCARTGLRVVSVDYRLAPEHKHPAAFEDSYAATAWAASHWRLPVVVVGDSAGGNLAAAVAHTARDKLTGIAGQVLIYPGLGGNVDEGSYVSHAEAPMLSRDDVLYYTDTRYSGDPPSDDPTATPLADTNFADLPPSVIITAECDPLSDDGRHYRDRIVAAGGRAVWFNEAGLVHGYLRARHSVRRAGASFDRIVDAIAALARGDWPY